MPSDSKLSSVSINPVTVKYRDKRGVEHTKVFSNTFVVGRDHSCDLLFEEECVSRQHVRFMPDKEMWIIQDLGSTNGTYLDNQQIKTHRLSQFCKLQLGNEGPILQIQDSSQEANLDPTGESLNVHDAASRYLDEKYDGPMGDFTRSVRHAIAQSSKKQSRSYLYLIGVVSVLLLAVLGYTVFQQYRLEQLDSITVDIFYNMKEVELQISALETLRATPGSSRATEQLNDMRARLVHMEKNYDSYLYKAGHLDANMGEEERLILRVARIFGECEVNLPEEFINEVKKYIKKWKSSKRLPEAIERAKVNGYTSIVRDVMMQYYLPPQFFYLALQESDYKRNSIGPRTRYGIAKGIWQFIPSTASRYGLKTGPLIQESSYDPKDERFDFEKSTRAAARYIRDIYTTDAQASGLLVMASYNWGEHKIINRIRDMPENPRDRNFWKLLRKHELPKETYDYVYYIFSAAVIGENPKLFGFEFSNPLSQLSDKHSAVAFQ